MTADSTKNADIVVIGAGVIGMAIAQQLLETGRSVLLVDPGAPGGGASYGNAGTIADYAILPVGSPAVLRDLPALLFNKNSPLSIRRAALFSLAPWLIRFFRQSFPGATQRNIVALAGIVADAAPRWQTLARQVGAQETVRARGCLYLYETQASFRRGKQDIAYRQTLGVKGEMLNPQELSQLEPRLTAMGGGAAYFPDAVFLSDPGKVMALLYQYILQAGAEFHQAAAVSIDRQPSGIRVVLSDGVVVHARQVVIAAGAHSRDLARQAGDKIPLDTERGYHLEYDTNEALLHRPACGNAQGFYMCPMSGRLRVAGSVELGGLNPKPSQHRLDNLQRGVARYLPGLGDPSRSWLGFRPSIPDSRPVISASKMGNDIVYAFGHGHIGLTLAPITAEAVSAIIAGTTSPIKREDFAAQRF
ncbi:MAG: glycine/D-amino acid oxidase-like deaminating enzyme [Urechidicola sp.]|jgi:glycine/D-amino acid oxidase-like deaminating enzyme